MLCLRTIFWVIQALRFFRAYLPTVLIANRTLFDTFFELLSVSKNYRKLGKNKNLVNLLTRLNEMYTRYPSKHT